MAYLDRDGTPIYYEVTGAQNGNLPVLLSHGFGARDQAFLAAAEYMAAKIPGAAHAVIPDAGHASNIDQPDLFNQQVLAFLQRPGPG